jgi:hypothetical protein
VTKLPSTPFDWSISTYTPAAVPRTREPLPCIHLLPQDIVSFLHIKLLYSFQTSNHGLLCYLASQLNGSKTRYRHRGLSITYATMSSRNRQPRASLNQDADEERRLWNMIREGAKKIDSMVVRSDFLVFFLFLYISCSELLFSFRLPESVYTREERKVFRSRRRASRVH